MVFYAQGTLAKLKLFFYYYSMTTCVLTLFVNLKDFFLNYTNFFWGRKLHQKVLGKFDSKGV